MKENYPRNLQEAALDLYEACKEFVARVESNEIRSKRSYARMKAAIIKAEGLSGPDALAGEMAPPYVTKEDSGYELGAGIAPRSHPSWQLKRRRSPCTRGSEDVWGARRREGRIWGAHQDDRLVAQNVVAPASCQQMPSRWRRYVV